MDLFNKKKVSELERRLKEEQEARISIESRDFVSENRRLTDANSQLTQKIRSYLERENNLYRELPKNCNVLVVEDNDEHYDRNLFPEEMNVRRVRSACDALLLITNSDRYLNRGSEFEKPAFDIVLTDLNLPYDGERSTTTTHFHEAFSGEEILPYGFMIAEVCIHHRIPRVGLLTDTNHHKGHMASLFDLINHKVIQKQDSLVVYWDMRSGVYKKGNDGTPNHELELLRSRRSDAEGIKCYANLAEYLRNPTRYA